MLKYAKTILEKGIQQEPSLKPSSSFESRPVYDSHPPGRITKEPETIIGEHVTIKGAVSFDTLLKVDGTFEGEIDSKGDLVVGPKGVVKANLDLNAIYASGKIEGNITAKERVVLKDGAQILGDITTPLLSVDEGVSIIGKVHVTAPERLPEVDSPEF